MVKKRILLKEKKKLKLKSNLKRIALEKIQKNHDFEVKNNDEENFMRYQDDNKENGETKGELKYLENSNFSGTGIGSVIVGAVNGTYEQERREDLLRKHKLVADPFSPSFSTSFPITTSSVAGNNLRIYCFAFFSFLLLSSPFFSFLLFSSLFFLSF